ncbi:transportin-3-like [Cherax quadricarinatus]|uniref:transportin-3-like n=1 Tax=Cherax quadricarinatus TaxID=27406 RepID=UPI00387E286B
MTLLLYCITSLQVAEITFNFWYKLSEVLYRKNCDNVNEQFKPYVERLIEALYRHCQIEPDHESILVQQDDFYEFRERVQELIKDVVFICGSKLCFQQMAHILQSPDISKNWNLMEAALFIMQSVAKNLVPEENEVVPPILEGLLSQPDDIHLQVAFTSVQLLAELNEWIACHPNLLPLVLQFLTKRLHNKHLATVAAKSNLSLRAPDHCSNLHAVLWIFLFIYYYHQRPVHRDHLSNMDGYHPKFAQKSNTLPSF